MISEFCKKNGIFLVVDAISSFLADDFDMNKLENRKMLIDTFANSVVFYDDRIDFCFNIKDNAKSLTLSELNTVSDLSSSSPP